MFKFGKKQKGKGRKLILDIGTQYVKIVDLTVESNKAKLHNYRILNLIQDGKRFISKEISKIVKKSILDMKNDEKLVYTSISGKSVIVRFMDLPKMTRKELKNSLKYQTDLRLPFDLNDAMFDCQILDGIPVPEGKMKVVVAAAPRKEAAKVLEVIKGAGYFARKVDVDVVALANAYQWGASQTENEAIALVNIGAARTNLSILTNRIPVLCRELNFGGISFTEAIASQMEIGFDEAETKKIAGDPSISSIIEEAIKPVSSGLAQSFDFFEGSSGIHVSKVYLSGGGAQIRGVMDFLKASLNRNVFIWNPLRSVDMESIDDKELLLSNSPLLTIALGVGLGDAGND